MFNDSVVLSQLKPQILKLSDIFQRKGKVSKIDFLFNKPLETALSLVSINGNAVTSTDECTIILSYIELLEKRAETEILWDELMVDSNEGDGPLRMTGEGTDQSTKQRYNVAASRAKDQLWIVHSLDYSKDLKSGDLRRDLLEYADNPRVYSRLVETVEAKAESQFEEAVGKSLVASGYHITQQWEVGA